MVQVGNILVDPERGLWADRLPKEMGFGRVSEVSRYLNNDKLDRTTLNIIGNMREGKAMTEYSNASLGILVFRHNERRAILL